MNTAKARATYFVDPSLFDDQQWVELFSAVGFYSASPETALSILQNEDRTQVGELRECSRERILDMIDSCEVKALRVSTGGYGLSDAEVNITAWAAELREIANILKGIINK